MRWTEHHHAFENLEILTEFLSENWRVQVCRCCDVYWFLNHVPGKIMGLAHDDVEQRTFLERNGIC